MASSNPSSAPANPKVNDSEARRPGIVAGNNVPPASSVPAHTTVVNNSLAASSSATPPNGSVNRPPMTKNDDANTTVKGLVTPKSSPPSSPGTAQRTNPTGKAPLVSYASPSSSPSCSSPQSESSWFDDEDDYGANMCLDEILSLKDLSPEQKDNTPALSPAQAPSYYRPTNGSTTAFLVPTSAPTTSTGAPPKQSNANPPVPTPKTAASGTTSKVISTANSKKRAHEGELPHRNVAARRPDDAFLDDFNPVQLPPIKPNGSGLISESVLMQVLETWWVSLKKVNQSYTPERIRAYVLNKLDFAPQVVRSNPAACRAYLGLDNKSQYDRAVRHQWEFGVLAHSDYDDYDPKEPQGCRYQMLLTTDTFGFPNMQVRVAKALVKAHQIELQAVIQTKNDEIAVGDFGCWEDLGNYGHLGRIEGSFTVPAEDGDTAHTITPLPACTNIDDPRFVKIHASNLPQRTEDAKFTVSLRHHVTVGGLPKDSVLFGGVQHKKDTGTPTSYGFVIIRQSAISFFLETPLMLRQQKVVFSTIKDNRKEA